MSGLLWICAGMLVIWAIGTHMIVGDLLSIIRILESRLLELERRR